jgi:hypothetical protein
MNPRRTSSVPKEDVVFPRMLYCDLRCSQTLPGLSPALPGALQCNATRRLGDGKPVILRQRVRGSIRAVRAVRNTRVFQKETGVVADDASRWLNSIAAFCLIYVPPKFFFFTWSDVIWSFSGESVVTVKWLSKLHLAAGYTSNTSSEAKTGISFLAQIVEVISPMDTQLFPDFHLL